MPGGAGVIQAVAESLVAGDEARIVTADALRFSRAEVASLFDEERDLALSEPELDAVFDGTEGWLAAVQLCRLALGSQAVRASLRSDCASVSVRPGPARHLGHASRTMGGLAQGLTERLSAEAR